MEENRVETTPVTGNVNRPEDSPALDGYVSPEIVAAEQGNVVDFSKHVYVDDDPALGLVSDNENSNI